MMTDNEIIKALECCMNGHCGDGCPFGKPGENCRNLDSLILDLINRQKAEIERLNAMVEAAENYLHPLPFKNAFDEEIDKSKAEAVKEFAEKVKALNRQNLFLWNEQIDNLVKEMVGEG